MAAALPRHVAIIMDGNGRWASARGLPRIQGHEEGAKSVKAITRACRRKGIGYLTLYSFSTENWRRPADEVKALMGLLGRYVVEERSEILDHGIRLRAFGQIDRLPRVVRMPLDKLCRDSAEHSDMVLSLALSYGSRAEIIEAVRSIAGDVKRRKIKLNDIDETLFSSRLSTAGIPDPDLLIRTSGEYRISNFLLWQIAYSELYVTDVSWPEFREDELDAALASYAGRERRYGKTGKQLKEGS